MFWSYFSSTFVYLAYLNRSLELFTPQIDNFSGITEETPRSSQRRRQNLVLEIPVRKLENCYEDVRINMAPTSSPTPRRVNFLSTPSCSEARNVTSPGSACSRSKSIKDFWPKFNFRNRHAALDIEKAYDLARGVPPAGSREKSSISTSLSRSFSLSKIFTPRIKRTSSLPVTPLGGSAAESAHGCLGNNLNPNVSIKLVDHSSWNMVNKLYSTVKLWCMGRFFGCLCFLLYEGSYKS